MFLLKLIPDQCFPVGADSASGSLEVEELIWVQILHVSVEAAAHL